MPDLADTLDLARRFAQIESSDNPHAWNTLPGGRRSRYRGLYQFGPDLEQRYGITDWTDRSQQDRAFNQHIGWLRGALTRSLGRAPDDWELYFAHQQGVAGAPAILGAAPDTPAWRAIRQYYGSDALAQQAVTGNIPRGHALYGRDADGITAGDFAQMWRSRFGRTAPPSSQAGAPAPTASVAGAPLSSPSPSSPPPAPLALPPSAPPEGGAPPRVGLAPPGSGRGAPVGSGVGRPRGIPGAGFDLDPPPSGPGFGADPAALVAQEPPRDEVTPALQRQQQGLSELVARLMRPGGYGSQPAGLPVQMAGVWRPPFGSGPPRSFRDGGRVGRADAVEAALRIAAGKTDTRPSEAAKETGRYAKGTFAWNGLKIAIENPKGSTRSGMGRDGKRWSVRMPATYGEILKTEGMDGDPVDAYVGSDHASSKVFVIDQVDAETGKPDEHKVMLSYGSKEAALADYVKAFSDGKGRDRIGAVTEMSVEAFKGWLKSPRKTAKPAAVALVKSYATGGAVMPLLKGKANVGRNVSELMGSGRSQRQSVAIALDIARRRGGKPGAKSPAKVERRANGGSVGLPVSLAAASNPADAHAWLRHPGGERTSRVPYLRPSVPSDVLGMPMTGPPPQRGWMPWRHPEALMREGWTRTPLSAGPEMTTEEMAREMAQRSADQGGVDSAGRRSGGRVGAKRVDMRGGGRVRRYADGGEAEGGPPPSVEELLRAFVPAQRRPAPTPGSALGMAERAPPRSGDPATGRLLRDFVLAPTTPPPTTLTGDAVVRMLDVPALLPRRTPPPTALAALAGPGSEYNQPGYSPARGMGHLTLGPGSVQEEVDLATEHTPLLALGGFSGLGSLYRSGNAFSAGRPMEGVGHLGAAVVPYRRIAGLGLIGGAAGTALAADLLGSPSRAEAQTPPSDPIATLNAQRAAAVAARDKAIADRDAQAAGDPRRGIRAGRGPSYDRAASEVDKYNAEIEGIDAALDRARYEASPEGARDADRMREAERVRRELASGNLPFHRQFPNLNAMLPVLPFAVGATTSGLWRLPGAIGARRQARAWGRAVEAGDDPLAGAMQANYRAPPHGVRSYAGPATVGGLEGALIANLPSEYNALLPAINPDRTAWEEYAKRIPSGPRYDAERRRVAEILAGTPEQNPWRPQNNMTLGSFLTTSGMGALGGIGGSLLPTTAASHAVAPSEARIAGLTARTTALSGETSRRQATALQAAEQSGAQRALTDEAARRAAEQSARQQADEQIRRAADQARREAEQQALQRAQIEAAAEQARRGAEQSARRAVEEIERRRYDRNFSIPRDAPFDPSLRRDIPGGGAILDTYVSPAGQNEVYRTIDGLGRSRWWRRERNGPATPIDGPPDNYRRIAGARPTSSRMVG